MGYGDYGKEIVVPPLPLSFDRVNEGRFPRSNSLLFTLPLEVLGIILQLVESDSLPALALVNQDCRQLARSRQFASIELNPSDSCLELIARLGAEDRKRKENGTDLSPSIGVCIRKIKVTDSTNWRGRFQIDESLMELDVEERDRRTIAAGKFYNGTYLPVVEYILSSRRLLPHLEELDLQCHGSFSQPFFNNLIQSSIQHLKLTHLSFDEDFSIGLPDTLWPLRTLHIELGVPIYYPSQVTTNPLSISILRLCAPTLESLTLINRGALGTHSFATAGLNSAPCFPRLRNIFLDGIIFLDSSMLDAFLQHNPRTFGVRFPWGPEYASFYQTRGTISSLEVLSLMVENEHHVPILCFLTANTHLSMLSLEDSIPAPLLETQLLPLLSSSFSKLTSLSLCWDTTFISESALEMISSLKTLQQIHLSAGHQTGWRHDFQVNHKEMRKHLQKLIFLKKIAFSRDSYRYESEGPPLELYYENKSLPEDQYADLEEREHNWEQEHRSRMLTEADQYGHIMPQLEWIYFGQIPMGLLLGTAKTAVALNTERDICYSLLRKMFGLYEGHTC